MKEFMLLIRNEKDHQSAWTQEKHEQFINACSVYIEEIKKNGKLKSAQPLVREGKMIARQKGEWKDGPFNETKEVIVGYYHILADSIDDAVAIAKGNPEFSYSDTARIEVRRVKMKEESTGYTYPKHS